VFVGSINQPTRKLLYAIRKELGGGDIYVGCSGNFTVEGILKDSGVLHSNDVSLYSYAIGQYITGNPVDYEIKDPDLKWIEAFWNDELDKVVTMVMSTEFLDYWYRRENGYFRRMATNYERNWEAIFTATKAKLEKALDLPVADYFNGDVVEYFANAPKDATLITFPPTYKGGYEKLFSHLERAYEWNQPSYEIVEPSEMFQKLAYITQNHDRWILMSDERKDDYPLFAKVHSGQNNKPVYLYGTIRESKYMTYAQKYEYFPYPPIKDDEIKELKLLRITMGQYRYLRALYLKKSIKGSDFIVLPLAIVNQDNKLIGLLGFTVPKKDLGLMVLDLSVERFQSKYTKLSKLILLISQTEEVKQLYQSTSGSKISIIQTTVYTDKPVSMKYRGIYKLERREEGRLIYRTQAGCLKLKDVLAIWKEKYENII